MTRATWSGAIVAEAHSDAVRILEGQVYFPPEAVDRRYLRESRTQTVSAELGVATYFDVVVDEEVNRDAAWSYAAPKPAGEEIAGYVAFWKGVAIEQDA